MARSALKSSSKRRGKRRQRKSPLTAEAAKWAVLVSGAGFLTWSVYFPGSAGVLGGSLHAVLFDFLGKTALLLPPLICYAFFTFLRRAKMQGLLTMALGSLLFLLSAALLLTAAAGPDWGGALGRWLGDGSAGVLGRFGSAFLAFMTGLWGLQVLFDISWGVIIVKTTKMLQEDYRSWLRSRQEFKSLIQDAARKHLPSQDTTPGIAPIPAPARAGAAPVEPEPEPQAPPTSGSSASKDPPIIKPKLSAKERSPKASAKTPQPVPSAKGEKPYVFPPLSLLAQGTAGAGSGRPSDAEIQEAVANLEATLASFSIEASVSGISPGPVITRYEVTPARGVTVSSIVARSNDIALTMKARGIRMIAPIPGKAAIGIEIPNQKGALVTLREVLESPALSGKQAPLSFALGLASDGTPLAADLQELPHVLVAGATNSGKSVMIHSLIASLLYRQHPDAVKLLLIDPKRIELTLYDGIPHLYNPKSPPSEVEVITEAQQAARALKALVRVMEDRYEKFQAYRVQNIQQYNREAVKRGERPEFFIVVIIDELADLMIVARDVVEDSIQRLTQMARAVGIHLVIATQRPSVDVLTGVIKANLPSRIAMRVASKVDSKVVIDGNGAEALLGRGDALYISPGIEPARIQGCYVSTEEIGAVVDHLKKQAKPDYPLLDMMMSSMGEADLSQFGVEPLEFTQAMKLVLERRRISQDLLKSQFGSSARATNLLSLLEVKGFIFKPEGSNRWQIHFEKIEDYLRKHTPQALKKKGI